MTRINESAKQHMPLASTVVVTPWELSSLLPLQSPSDRLVSLAHGLLTIPELFREKFQRGLGPSSHQLPALACAHVEKPSTLREPSSTTVQTPD